MGKEAIARHETQTTISSLMKMAASYPNGLKTLWEKKKLLVMSNFSFSYSVFKRLQLQARKNQESFGKGLNYQRPTEVGSIHLALIQLTVPKQALVFT